MKRYLTETVRRDLGKKMVYLTGPRQVGKTTVALELLAGKPGYLNWDTDEGRTAILAKNFPLSDLLVFDEIHKFRR